MLFLLQSTQTAITFLLTNFLNYRHLCKKLQSLFFKTRPEWGSYSKAFRNYIHLNFDITFAGLHSKMGVTGNRLILKSTFLSIIFYRKKESRSFPLKQVECKHQIVIFNFPPTYLSKKTKGFFLLLLFFLFSTLLLALLRLIVVSAHWH